MKNFVQRGHSLTMTAPYALLSGAGMQVGSIFGVASADADNGASVEAELVGVYSLAKVSAQAWTAGARIYWDNGAKLCTTTVSTNLFIGIAAEGASNPSDTGKVRLNGAAPQVDPVAADAKAYVTARITDISTPGSYWTVAPIAGEITKVWTVLFGAITGADATVTVEIGGVAVGGVSIAITQSGSAAGDVDTDTPSSANTVTAGQAIEVITDGGSTGTVPVEVVLEITGS